MIISFRCPPKLKERIDTLIDAGLYPDLSSFCVTALENQLLLEKTHDQNPDQLVAPAGGVPSGMALPRRGSRRGRYSRRPDSVGASVDSSSIGPSSPILAEGQDVAASEKPVLVTSPAIPPEFALVRLSGEGPFSLPSTFADLFQPGQEVSVERWLFGQYNRLLPAKVSIRALAVIAMEGKNALYLEAAAPRIAEAAAQLGSYLRSLDRRFGHHRDDALATAFPEGGVEGQKGRVRYQNHFVGHTVKGEQGGLLVGLKLAVIQLNKNKPYILPTTAGWELARLPNPLLDGPISESPVRLSEEETGFLLRHIKEHVAVELFAYRVIVSLISQEKNTPELVNHGIANYLTPGRKLEDEQDFVSTQKNGVLGRMNDLGLVGRERQGTRISYFLTLEGKKFLDEVGAIPAAA